MHARHLARGRRWPFVLVPGVVLAVALVALALAAPRRAHPPRPAPAVPAPAAPPLRIVVCFSLADAAGKLLLPAGMELIPGAAGDSERVTVRSELPPVETQVKRAELTTAACSSPESRPLESCTLTRAATISLADGSPLALEPGAPFSVGVHWQKQAYGGVPGGTTGGVSEDALDCRPRAPRPVGDGALVLCAPLHGEVEDGALTAAGVIDAGSAVAVTQRTTVEILGRRAPVTIVRALQGGVRVGARHVQQPLATSPRALEAAACTTTAK